MYSVFGDESYDEKRKRVFAVAGLLGTEDEWDALVQKWTKATKGEEFHANKWQTDNRHKEYAALTKLLAASNLIGMGAVMNLTEYRTIFDNAADDFLPYYICFIRVINMFGEMTSRLIPQGKVKFTFDQNLDVRYNAAAIYDHIARYPEWQGSGFLEDEISFSSRKSPRIQATDLWAYEVMKHMDNTIISIDRRPTRLSLQALRTTKRFGFDMLDTGYFQGWKDYALKNPRSGDERYGAWLEKLKIDDNMTNRIRFEILMSEVRRGKKPPEN